MVAEPGCDQGPVMPVDSKPSLPSKMLPLVSLSQDAPHLVADENLGAVGARSRE